MNKYLLDDNTLNCTLVTTHFLLSFFKALMLNCFTKSNNNIATINKDLTIIVTVCPGLNGTEGNVGLDYYIYFIYDVRQLKVSAHKNI